MNEWCIQTRYLIENPDMRSEQNDAHPIWLQRSPGSVYSSNLGVLCKSENPKFGGEKN